MYGKWVVVGAEGMRVGKWVQRVAGWGMGPGGCGLGYWGLDSEGAGWSLESWGTECWGLGVWGGAWGRNSNNLQEERDLADELWLRVGHNAPVKRGQHLCSLVLPKRGRSKCYYWI